MIIGYSCWGFLGNGILDTPDGGRSHRRVLIDGLLAAGHEVILLQRDRDRLEAGDRLPDRYRFAPAGFPALDGLLLEWRWPIPHRNTTPCGTAGHSCDLHRQEELLEHYTFARGTPTLLWDKDRQLPAEDPIRDHPAIAVCEAALFPAGRAGSLLFPVADEALDRADPAALVALPRSVDLAYVGNQYDRDDQFDTYLAPAAARLRYVVAGKWPETARWPGLVFSGRIPFAEVDRLYRNALATVTLLPARYRAVGQMTQRIFEAALAGCLPIVPTDIRGAHRFAPPTLLASSGSDVTAIVHSLRAIAGSSEHRDLLAAVLDLLRPRAASRQVRIVESVMASRARAAQDR